MTETRLHFWQRWCFKNCWSEVVDTHRLYLSNQESEARGLPLVWGQFRLYGGFQAILSSVWNSVTYIQKWKSSSNTYGLPYPTSGFETWRKTWDTQSFLKASFVVANTYKLSKQSVKGEMKKQYVYWWSITHPVKTVVLLGNHKGNDSYTAGSKTQSTVLGSSHSQNVSPQKEKRNDLR